MEFEGLVYKVLPVVKGTSPRGEWVKQEVVFELPGEFNRKLCVGFWGDKAADAGNLREGERIAVSINLESREYNGRWFTEARAWKIAKVAAQQPVTGDMPPMPEMPPYGYGAPAGGASQSAPASSKPLYESDAADDLPF